MRRRSRFLVMLALILTWSMMMASEAHTQILDVPEEHQEQTRWCWAASSRAIIRFDGSPSVLQCDIVNWVRVQKGWGPDDCCIPPNGSGSSCNHGNYLYHGTGSCKDVLDHWGSQYEGVDDALTRAETTSQMEAPHPVMIRYDWWNGGAHALILHGFTAGTDMANIMDPWYGPYIADFDWVESGSPPGHDWTRSLKGVATAPPPSGGVDVVFIVDVSGSTGGVRDEYKTMIESLAAIYELFAPASRYALTYFMDFPLDGYGSGNDVAYGIETDFVNGPADLTAPLQNLPDGNGADTPESQYTAVYQAITGSGVDLNDDYDYADAGEIAPSSLNYSPGNLNAYYLFTYPVDFHNSDDEAAYPVDHTLPPPFDESADDSCSRILTLQALIDLLSHGMLFGITLISEPVAPPIADRDGPLEELAEAAGGTTYEIDLVNAEEMAQESFDWFYSHLSLAPLAIVFDAASFSAIERDGYVEVTWTTVTEFNNAGFNLYRNTSENGVKEKLNRNLIPSNGNNPEGSVYTFKDYDVTQAGTYYYWSEEVSLEGEPRMHGPVSAKVGAAPLALRVFQNYLNPSNRITEIRYGLQADCHVKLEIYNVLGQKVATLLDEHQRAGRGVIHWNAGSEISSGLYLCRMQAGGLAEIEKMVVLK